MDSYEPLRGFSAATRPPLTIGVACVVIEIFSNKMGHLIKSKQKNDKHKYIIVIRIVFALIYLSF
jgi:hypothetical protein